MPEQNHLNLNSATQRIEELETKITFQDHSIDELNRALIQQQNDINKLMRVIENIVSQVERMGDSNTDSGMIELPPHY